MTKDNNVRKKTAATDIVVPAQHQHGRKPFVIIPDKVDDEEHRKSMTENGWGRQYDLQSATPKTERGENGWGHEYGLQATMRETQ